ncbi:MAG: ABC transporter ATP-binding protein [Sinobacteraceae bacterium]|nr:ABC transporter ATP-binding protein [Nevskiaceae bacterium]
MVSAPAADTPAVLDARNIALGYAHGDDSHTTILGNFSLQLGAGEVVAVLGPSGVGKSSLLRVLAGLQEPDHGRVSVGGNPLHGPHPRVSFVFQDACLLPWLTMEDNIGFGLDFKHQPDITRAEKRERIDAAIAEVGLDDARGAYPDELSGGMAQRVALARGIVRQPEILLLDEPFSALDEITRGEMQQLLHTLTRRHRTAAVLVTHDIDEALIVADRILLIGGRPAQLMNTWPIEFPHPRDEAQPELLQARVEIVRTMRQARDSVAPASTHH